MTGSGLAGPPPVDHLIPDLVREHAGRGPLSGVWLNHAGGVTYRRGDHYLKWNPPGSRLDLAQERVRLEWASAWHPVPAVLDFVDEERGQLLVTAAIDGLSAVDDRWKREPRRAAWAIGEGLRALHENLPVAACPFVWHPELEIEMPEHDHLVVCHGDPCAPNTLLGADGRWVAHLDLGRLGIGDRWVDLAVGSANLDGNFGPGYQDEYFAAYGIDRDEDRIRFYRELWDRSDQPSDAPAP